MNHTYLTQHEEFTLRWGWIQHVRPVMGRAKQIQQLRCSVGLYGLTQITLSHNVQLIETQHSVGRLVGDVDTLNRHRKDNIPAGPAAKLFRRCDPATTHNLLTHHVALHQVAQILTRGEIQSYMRGTICIITCQTSSPVAFMQFAPIMRSYYVGQTKSNLGPLLNPSANVTWNNITIFHVITVVAFALASMQAAQGAQSAPEPQTNVWKSNVRKNMQNTILNLERTVIDTQALKPYKGKHLPAMNRQMSFGKQTFIVDSNHAMGRTITNRLPRYPNQHLATKAIGLLQQWKSQESAHRDQ